MRDVAHYRALKSGSTSDWASYRRLCNKVNTMLLSAKAEYFSNIVSSLIGLIWKHFQSLSKYSRSVCGSSQAIVTANDFNDLLNIWISSFMRVHPLLSSYLLMLNHCL